MNTIDFLSMREKSRWEEKKENNKRSINIGRMQFNRNGMFDLSQPHPNF